MRCVVCGQPTGNNHRCPKSVEGAWQAQQTKALRDDDLEYETPRLAEHTRLFVGLAAMEREDR